MTLRWSTVDHHRPLSLFAIAGLFSMIVFSRTGLPPIHLHGPLHRFGIMDPACGVTRGTVALLRANLSTALRYNPATPLIVLGGVAALLRAAYGTASGRWLTVRVRRTPLLIVAVGLGLAALEINQQLHAGLLMR